MTKLAGKKAKAREKDAREEGYVDCAAAFHRCICNCQMHSKMYNKSFNTYLYLPNVGHNTSTIAGVNSNSNQNWSDCHNRVREVGAGRHEVW